MTYEGTLGTQQAIASLGSQQQAGTERKGEDDDGIPHLVQR